MILWRNFETGKRKNILMLWIILKFARCSQQRTRCLGTVCGLTDLWPPHPWDRPALAARQMHRRKYCHNLGTASYSAEPVCDPLQWVPNKVSALDALGTSVAGGMMHEYPINYDKSQEANCMSLQRRRRRSFSLQFSALAESVRNV
jgi:hypothetical protein